MFGTPFIKEVYINNKIKESIYKSTYKALYLSELPQTLRIQLYLFLFEAKVNATHLIWQYTL